MNGFTLQILVGLCVGVILGAVHNSLKQSDRCIEIGGQPVNGVCLDVGINEAQGHE